MDPYAQTNIQLYEQLRSDGYSAAEIGKISVAYGICPGLFACLYRPSGKTFIAHLVGTASVLASLRVPIDIVTAGLLHAAYANGDFGTGVYGVSDAKRSQLRQAVGASAEEYIARYTGLLWWTEDNISAVYRRVNDLDSVDRDVLLIRLANELEELLDFGWLYWSSLEGRRLYRDGIGRMVIEMAETIGFPVLAKQLEQCLNRSATTDIPIEIRDESPAVMATASTMIPSRVIRLKPLPYIRRRIVRSLPRLRNLRVAHVQFLCRRLYRFMRRRLRSNTTVWPRKGLQGLGPSSACGQNGSRISEAWVEMNRVNRRRHNYAQTIIQLYGQLFSAGYSNEGVRRVRDAYALAAVLFSGRFQPSGKTFMAHVVGTASILASVGSGVDLICAGLMHNVYYNGDFGNGRPGISGDKRRELQKHVGLEVERYLTEFVSLPWEREGLLARCDRLEKVNLFARGALLIRAADELEHLLDREVKYCGAASRRYYLDNAATYVQISESLGMRQLAREIQKAFEQTNSDKTPTPNCLQATKNVSYSITPPSYRRKVCGAMMIRVRESLHNAPSIAARKLKRVYWNFSKPRPARSEDRL